MAFYGNITNTSKTTFSFDRTYSNRYEMDIKANSDGVFVGRYVLVDYDENLDSQSYLLDAGNESVFLYDLGGILGVLMALMGGATTVALIAFATFIKSGVAV